MAIFVSEPGRPVGTRLPEAFRGRRVDTVSEMTEYHAITPSHSDVTDAEFINAQWSSKRRALDRALEEYGESADEGPGAQRAYLPVSRICTPALYSLPASATMAEALSLMEEHSVHHLVIMADDNVAGLVDLRWILKRLHETGANAVAQSFSRIELPAFLTASPETDAHQLARLMLAHQLNAALVIDRNGTPVGIVTSTDYLRLYAEVSRQEGNV